MELVSIFMGLFIIGLGFFIKKYPNTLAGYNTMSYREFKKVDIKSIASTYKKGLIIIGIATIIGTLSFLWLKLYIAATIALIAPLIIGVLVLILITQKYNHNKQSKFERVLPVVIIVGISIAITTLFIYSARPTRVEFSDGSITFTGQYGITIQTDQIEKVELLDNIPYVKVRTNGIGLGNILKGHFILNEFGKCHLFLRLQNPPFLYIELSSGKKILFNSTDSTYTKEVYKHIMFTAITQLHPSRGSSLRDPSEPTSFSL